MSSDFSAKARSARELIDVPDVPMDAIRSRSRAARGRFRVQAVIASALLALVVLGAGTGAGAKLYSTVRVWLGGGKAGLTVSSFTGVREPMSDEFRNAIAHASFPIVFPAGFPDGTRVSAVYATPVGHPNAIVLAYENARTGLKASFVLVDPAVVELGDRMVKMNGGSPKDVYSWRTAGELVLMPKTVSQAVADRIKDAMTTASPSDSLAATETMLPKVTALGGPNRLDLAERHRAPNGRNVLIDGNQVKSIPSLAANGKPFLDMRVFTVTSFPYVNGEPDYAKAKGFNARTVAIPPNGVRAVNAVLRSIGAGGGAGCGCEVLFNQPGPATYAIATIPLAPSDEVKTYTVDARTLAVTPADRR